MVIRFLDSNPIFLYRQDGSRKPDVPDISVFSLDLIGFIILPALFFFTIKKGQHVFSCWPFLFQLMELKYPNTQ